METAKEVLKKYWGYGSFREPQEEIINSLIDGKDSLIILSTGGVLRTKYFCTII